MHENNLYNQTNHISVIQTKARKLSLQPNKSNQNNLNQSKKMIWNNQTDHVNVIWTKARKYLYNQTNQIKIIWTEARNDLNNQTDHPNEIWIETKSLFIHTKQIKSNLNRGKDKVYSLSIDDVNVNLLLFVKVLVTLTTCCNLCCWLDLCWQIFFAHATLTDINLWWFEDVRVLPMIDDANDNCLMYLWNDLRMCEYYRWLMMLMTTCCCLSK